VYNSADRLEKVLLPDGSSATYTYDPFGRRVKKDVAGEVTYYLYSDEGLIGEYDASGSLEKGYGWKPNGIWGTDPVFMTEGGSYYFYRNDHLGTPQKLIDENGNVVWSAEYTAFGEAIVDPASTVENNLRFPGQYFDEETNLHYNWNRYYSSEEGRFTQPDPISFLGGDENLYRYVENSVPNFFDPLGDAKYSSADELMKVGRDTTNMKEFQPRNGTTYCNMGVNHIESVGGNDDYNGLTANQIVKKLQYKNYAREITPEEAVAYAKKGVTVIAGVTEKGHGHVAIVAPMKMERSGSWGRNVPYVFNVGADNGVMKASDAFSSRNKPRFYVRIQDTQ